jgi:PKD repeat protein
MRKIFLIILVIVQVKHYSQCTPTISPASQSISCATGSVSFTAFAGGLATYRWYSPLSPLQKGSPILTSVNSTMSVLQGSFAPGIYTLATTNGSCASSATFQVTSPDPYPQFLLDTTYNFWLGCGPLSQTTLNIMNAVSTQTPPATISYTFLPPGWSGTLSPGAWSVLASTVTQIPGTWTVTVKDNANNCRAMLPVRLVLDTIKPGVNISIPSTTIMCSLPTIGATASSTTAGTTLSWLVPSTPSAINSPDISVGPPTGPPTSTTLLTYGNYTAVAMNTLNACQSTLAIQIYQNFRPPIANATFAIASPTAIPCNSASPVVLSSSSSTTTSGGAGASIINPCWSGPPPQTTVCGATDYSVYTQGTQTLVVTDSYNGCSGTDSIYVSQLTGGNLTAAYEHTVGLNGIVTFSSNSVGTNSNTTYAWNFGDGWGASGAIVNHTYQSAGGYAVSLSISDGPSCPASIIQNINVTGIACIANTNFSIAPTGTPQYWNAKPQYPYNVTQVYWSWGDGSSSNFMYASHTYSAPGLYNICLSATVSCGNSASTCVNHNLYKSAEVNQMVYISVIPPTFIGMEENSGIPLEFGVYPNPSNGKVNLKLNQAGKIKVQVYNIVGELLNEIPLVVNEADMEYSLNLENLNEGIYFMKLSSGSKSSTQKLIISR